MNHSLPEISLLNERYQMLRCLYQRDHTQTWLGQDQTSQTDVIIKILDLKELPDWQNYELFEREARILGQLDHARIPQLLDYFQLPAQQQAVLVLERLPGETLRERMRQGWKVTETKARDLATQALAILTYIHSQSPPLVHRDLKPENILLDSNDQFYLIDFGAVREQTHTHHTVAGSFAYMAPEQLNGRVVPASDLYGLGVTLIELLSACSPQDLPRQGLYLDIQNHLNVSAGFKRWLEHLVAPFLPQRFASAELALQALQAPEHLPVIKMQASLKPRHQDEEITPQMWLKRQQQGLNLEIRGSQTTPQRVLMTLTQILVMLALTILIGWGSYRLLYALLRTMGSFSGDVDIIIIPILVLIFPQVFIFGLLRLHGVASEEQDLTITADTITHRYLKPRGARKPKLITRVYSRQWIRAIKLTPTQLQIRLNRPQRLAFTHRIALQFPFPQAARERLMTALQAEGIQVE